MKRTEVARLIGAVLCVVALLGAVVAAALGEEEPPLVLVEAPGGGSGDAPFTSDLRRVAEVPRSAETVHEGRVGGQRADVTEPLMDEACDRDRLVADLATDPQRAAVWSDVLGLSGPDVIATYVGRLRPAVLLQDAIVMNHAFRGGGAEANRTVLEAGNAVLVDQDGVPRVLCKCGNPLLETDPTADAVSIVAERATPTPTTIAPPPTTTPTAAATAVPTATPVALPSPTATTTPTTLPTVTPTSAATATPTPRPTATSTPTATPNPSPTATPSPTPTAEFAMSCQVSWDYLATVEELFVTLHFTWTPADNNVGLSVVQVDGVDARALDNAVLDTTSPATYVAALDDPFDRIGRPLITTVIANNQPYAGCPTIQLTEQDVFGP